MTDISLAEWPKTYGTMVMHHSINFEIKRHRTDLGNTDRNPELSSILILRDAIWEIRILRIGSSGFGKRVNSERHGQ